MVIYGNNLAEKLFGIAISRDYLRYSTPYCELVEDPDFIIDIDLAVDFNTALEGDPLAARRVVETMVLNSGLLDWSTIDFYVDKMVPHPYFQDEIRRVNDIFNNPDFPNVGDTGSDASDRKVGTSIGGGIPTDTPGNPVGFSNPGGQTGFPDIVESGEVTSQRKETALFDISRDNNVYILKSIIRPGLDYSVGDTIIITGDNLGGETPENDLEITITQIASKGEVIAVLLNGVAAAGTDNTIIGQVDIIGNEGTGALFDISNEEGEYVIDAITDPGERYTVGNKIIISGVTLGGTSTANDLIITITQVGADGSIISVDLKGSGVNDIDLFTDVNGELTGTTGEGSTFNIANQNGIYTIDSIANRGLGYIVGDILTITGDKLGGITPANDATVTVTQTGSGGTIASANITGGGIDILAAFNNVSGVATISTVNDIVTRTSGGGSTFNISKQDGIYILDDISNSGTGYITGSEIVITGDNVGGTSPENDIAITVTQTIDNGSIFDVDINGTGADGNETFTNIDGGAGTFTDLNIATGVVNGGGNNQQGVGQDINTNIIEDVVTNTNPGTLTDVDDDLINNVNRADAAFRNALQQASRDCTTAPCNIFTQTSDSVGRLTQNASSKVGENTFDLSSLKDVATDVVSGLDLTLFNKMPGIFQRAVVDVNTVAKQSWTTTQEALAGKSKVPKLSKAGLKQGTMRGSTSLGKVNRYTPDIKNFFDFEQAGQKMISTVAATLGPCFDKFQVAYRYNPYTDNMSTPLGVNIMQANGDSYSADPGGVYNSAGLSRAGSDDCGALLGSYGAGEGAAGSSSTSGDNTTGGGGSGIGGSSVLLGKDDEIKKADTYWISKPLASKNAPDANGWPFLAGGYIDRKKKKVIRGTVIQDGSDKGDTNIPKLKICPGYSLQDERFIEAKESNKLRAALNGKVKLKDKDLIVHKISNGWKHKLNENGMTRHQNEPFFADGAITNKSILDELLVVKNGLQPLQFGGSIEKAILDNKAFVVIRQTGKCAKIVQIVAHMSKGTNSPTYGLTPAAYEYVFEEQPIGVAVADKNNNPDVKATPWRFHKTQVKHKGDTEVRVAIGDYDEIKSIIDKELKCGDVEIPEGSAYITGKGGGCRNKPLHPDLEFILSKATIAAGCERVHLTSTGQMSKGDAISRGAVKKGSKWYLNGKCVRTGSVRHDIRTLNGKTGGTAADFKLYKNGNAVSIKDNATWAKFSAAFNQLSKNMGYTPGAGAGPSYMGNTVVHFDIANMGAIWVDTSSGVSNSRKLATTPWLGVFQGQNPESFA